MLLVERIIQAILTTSDSCQPLFSMVKALCTRLIRASTPHRLVDGKQYIAKHWEDAGMLLGKQAAGECGWFLPQPFQPGLAEKVSLGPAAWVALALAAAILLMEHSRISPGPLCMPRKGSLNPFLHRKLTDWGPTHNPWHFFIYYKPLKWRLRIFSFTMLVYGTNHYKFKWRAGRSTLTFYIIIVQVPLPNCY